MKKRILSLLMSAVMVFALVTPALSADEYTPGYSVDGSGIATVYQPEDLRHVYDDAEVSSVVIDSDLSFDTQDAVILTKPTTINAGTELRFKNTMLIVEADLTVNGELRMDGDQTHYSELSVRAPESYWTAAKTDSLRDGPALTNNGLIRTENMSGLMLVWPCSYVQNGDAEYSGGEFAYADLIDYNINGENSCVNGRYGTAATVETVFYDDHGEEIFRGVQHTAYINTESGLKTAIADTTYNSSITTGIFCYDGTPTTLSLTKGEAAEPVSFDMQCALLCNQPFALGEDVTLNLADTFNQFNIETTVSGVLNIRSENNLTILNDTVTVTAGAELNNNPGSNLLFSGNLSLTVEANALLHNAGILSVYANVDDADGTVIAGELRNTGRMENGCALIVADGGRLSIPDSDNEITYENNWEDAGDHVLFNSDLLRVRAGGTLEVGGALKNEGTIGIVGELRVLATARDNLADGVINGALRNDGMLNINCGTMTVEAAVPGEGRDCPAVFLNKGEFRVCSDAKNPENGDPSLNDPQVELNGGIYNFGYIGQISGEISVSGVMTHADGDILTSGGTFRIAENGRLENHSRITARDDGKIEVLGYFSNNNELDICGGLLSAEPAAADNTNNGDCDGQNSVLCNNGLLDIREGGEGEFKGGDGKTSFSAILHNNGTVNVDNGTLKMGGLFRNFSKLENRGDVQVQPSACIENHSLLMVDDSASYRDCGYQAINWQEGASAETNLRDDFQLRLAVKRNENDTEWYETLADFYGCKEDHWTDLIIVDGQEYFGGWTEVSEASARIENYKYNNEGFRDDQNGEPDPVEHLVLHEENGVYSIDFVEWGETALVVEQEITPQGEEPFTRRHAYSAGTSLDYAGFYTDGNILNEDGNLDEERAQDVAVLGRTYCYDNHDQLWMMKRGDGFDGTEEDVARDGEFFINGEYADIQPGEDGWYHVFYEGENVLDLKRIPRGNNDRFDILVEFPENVNSSFEFRFRYHDVDCSLWCMKPTVYVSGAVGMKGNDVTVAVKAENLPEMIGYQFQLKFDSEKLTAKSVEVNGDYYASTTINNSNGSVRVIVPSTEQNKIENGDLFYITFTIANTDAVGACEDISIGFDTNYRQKIAVLDGNSEKKINASYEGGTVQTFIAGDVHRDGEVDILDAVRLLRSIVGLISLDAAETEAALVVAEEDAPSILGVLAIMTYLAKDIPLVYKPVAED